MTTSQLGKAVSKLAQWHIVTLLALPVLLAAGDVSPSAEEIMLLDRINQHRENPPRCLSWPLNALRTKQVKGDRGEMNSLVKEGNKQGKYPPVIFNQLLNGIAKSLLLARTKAADAHRFDAAPAMRDAGYASDKGNLAMFAYDHPDLSITYAALFTNCIGERLVKKTTHHTFAGVVALDAVWREAGIAVATSNGKFSAVLVLAHGGAKRVLGGIVYNDTNRDGRYDAGEGKPGVKVTCGSASMTTAAGGAWWLSIDSLDATEVVFSSDAITAVRPITKDVVIAEVNWRFPNPSDQKTVDRLIIEAEKALRSQDADQHKGPLSTLLAASRMAAIDDVRQKRIDGLIEPIKESFDATLKKVLAALGEEPEEYKKRLAEIRKPWHGGMPGWFKEADGLSTLRKQINTVLAAPEDQQGKLALPLIKQLSKIMAESYDPVFLDQYRTWNEALAAALPSEGAMPEKKNK